MIGDKFPDAKLWRVAPSGLVVPKKRWPVAIDVFSGAGGMSLGTIQAGFQVIAAIENDPSAAMTYCVNLGAYPMQFHFATPEDEERLEKAMAKSWVSKKDGIQRMPVAGSGWRQCNPEAPGVEHFFFGDVRKFSGEEILRVIGFERGEVDLVMGSPPCQGFSTAGKRDVLDPRNSLVFDYARLVLEIYPVSMMMENVPGIVSMVTPEGIPVVDAFCKILQDGEFGGYKALKKMLVQNSGAGVAVKGKKREEKEESVEDDEMQLSFL